MSNKHRQEARALAKVGHRESSGTLADPIRVGIDKTIIIDMSKLATPSRSYDADVAWAEHEMGDVRLFFGKIDRDKPDQLRSRLEVRYAPESLLGHFWRNSREFHSTLSAFVATWPTNHKRNGLHPEKMTAEKTHSEWANFEGMAHAGTEAIVDFFTIPPTGIAMFARGQGSHGLQLVPIVRVQMSSFELVRLLDSLRPIVDEVKRYMPAGQERLTESLTEEEATV